MKNDNVLIELETTPQQTVRLAGNQRSRLLNFLLRWERVEEVHACLDVLIPVNPNLVSLLALRVRAFLAQDRPGDALVVMQERIGRKSSISARALLARVHLARGDDDAAHQIARTLVALEIARIVYQVLATGNDFNGCFKNKPLSRTKQSQWHYMEFTR